METRVCPQGGPRPRRYLQQRGENGFVGFDFRSTEPLGGHKRLVKDNSTMSSTLGFILKKSSQAVHAGGSDCF